MASSADPAFFFEDHEEATSEAHPPDSSSESLADADQAFYRPKAIPGKAPFYILLNSLSRREKAKYKSIEEWQAEQDEEAEEIVEIEGEHTIDGKQYCFARHKDGILRRKESCVFKTYYPRLYSEFKSKQENGQLSSFDPSSTRVHPAHRVSLKLNIRTSGLNVKKIVEQKRRGQDDYVDDSEPLTEPSESAEDSGDGDYVSSRHTRLRGAERGRQSAAKTRKLPFSPKKTKKGRRSFVIESESEADSEDGRRRSSRTKGRKNYAMFDDSDFDDSESSESEEDAAPTRKKSRPQKRKGPKPEYGLIRTIEDGYNGDSAPLRHRDECEKCQKAPSHILLRQPPRKKRKKRNENEDGFSEDEEEEATRLGGWVRCLKCCVAAHWRCLAGTQRAEIVKAIRARAGADSADDSVKIRDLEVDEATEFVCGSCSKGGVCMMCKEVVLNAEAKQKDGDNQDMKSEAQPDIELHPKAQDISETTVDQQLLFRCLKCKRLAHYSHLPMDDGLTVSEIAEFYQEENGWQCADCASYVYPLDKIIAWRPLPGSASGLYLNNPKSLNIKENLPRRYLVKWIGRSFRRIDWVPHMWLLSTNLPKLKNFYENGPKMQLLDKAEMDTSMTEQNKPSDFLDVNEASRDVSVEPNATLEDTLDGPPPPMPDAEQRIPPAWKTVDRVLDLLVWSPRQKEMSKASSGASRRAIASEDDEPDASAVFEAALDDGEEPSAEFTDTVTEYEQNTRRKLSSTDADLVVWIFVKWSDLPYDEATWDSPPRPGTLGYGEFKKAYEDFLRARTVQVKKKTASEIQKIETRGGRRRWASDFLGIPEDGVFDIGQDPASKLMPFQIEGVNWLCRNWFHHQHCILADEMGLGKTVQIISFLGILHAKMNIFPALVVVPNSTITNWVREFAKWAPAIRVVPFYGDAKSRDIIKQYELQHPDPAPGTTGAKYHVLVTTYETVTGQKDFHAVFKKSPRWEVLVVDEGQRLKNDTNLIFRRLNELNTRHRIIMTGTPLNNNIRELFNLMNFLNPDDWNDLETLSKEFEELDEDRIKTLHERLRPYFLRRVKADVLDLPPKNELIVPLSMTPLQKEIYRSILSKNLSVLKTLTESSARVNKATAKMASNLRNLLMQLRKCVQHPYLIADDIEPKRLEPVEEHSKLIDASAKLRFLRTLLPKLKSRGHRVLLFSQFVIALDIIEDFLRGEGYKFLRLDGGTKQAQRQKNMDEFNRADSDVFIFILSTRAGGVGINLWSADTVIIFDPDFNPHQDLQAIARAHRYGQTKTCLVFKFMTKDSAEEKIMQAGKKKLILDHLIVQKMDDVEDAGNIQSMLTFGAAALFEEDQESRDIKYSEQDVDKLIDKIETEGYENQSEPTTSNVLSFAKVWSVHKDDLDELVDDAENKGQTDSWAQALQKISEKQDVGQAREASGRGVRRKAARKVQYFEGGSPDKLLSESTAKKRRKLNDSEGSGDEYQAPSRTPSEAPTTASSPANEDFNELQLAGPADLHTEPKAKSSGHISMHYPIRDGGVEYCGLCDDYHKSGSCPMTQATKNLVEYRRMLIKNEDEPYDKRIAAIHAIDERLFKLGALNLIRDQPARPVQEDRPPLPSNPAASSSSGAAQIALYMNNSFTSIRAATSLPIWAIKATQAEAPQSTGMQGKGMYDNPHRPSGTTAAPMKTEIRICEICRVSPFHTPFDCPEVGKGVKSLTKVITRLSEQGGSLETLQALRTILKRQKRALQEANNFNK